MERLTEKKVNLWQIKECDDDTCKETCDKQLENGCDNCPIKKAIDKLAEYEDLEEQGLLLKMPCKEGDTVYVIGTKCMADVISDDECDSMSRCDICPYDKEYVVFTREVTKDFLYELLFNKKPTFIWGKNVFSNEEIANEMLKNMN